MEKKLYEQVLDGEMINKTIKEQFKQDSKKRNEKAQLQVSLRKDLEELIKVKKEQEV